ncbi:hypothetical protein [Caulobacter sp. S45]|uniref:hypothetical protein n=1 Tax=Caulobacter sp. S45 TaxID=1641861 RepID=UPI001575229E|nr:hypothetical protein [Caulobacter sp. S45]
MIAKLVSFVIALAAMAAAACVLVVSAAFAFYALLRTYIGPSGSAACVTLAAAIVLGVLALFLFSKAKGPHLKAKSKAADGSGSLVERLTDLVSDRPVVAASAAVAAGLLAWRNPTLVSTVLRVLEPRTERKRG